MGRSNVVSVEPSKEDIRDELPEFLGCRSGQTRRLFFSFSSLSSQSGSTRRSDVLKIKDSGAAVQAKVRVCNGNACRRTTHV